MNWNVYTLTAGTVLDNERRANMIWTLFLFNNSLILIIWIEKGKVAMKYLWSSELLLVTRTSSFGELFAQEKGGRQIFSAGIGHRLLASKKKGYTLIKFNEIGEIVWKVALTKIHFQLPGLYLLKEKLK